MIPSETFCFSGMGQIDVTQRSQNYRPSVLVLKTAQLFLSTFSSMQRSSGLMEMFRSPMEIEFVIVFCADGCQTKRCPSTSTPSSSPVPLLGSGSSSCTNPRGSFGHTSFPWAPPTRPFNCCSRSSQSSASRSSPTKSAAIRSSWIQPTWRSPMPGEWAIRSFKCSVGCV